MAEKNSLPCALAEQADQRSHVIDMQDQPEATRFKRHPINKKSLKINPMAMKAPTCSPSSAAAASNAGIIPIEMHSVCQFKFIEDFTFFFKCLNLEKMIFMGQPSVE